MTTPQVTEGVPAGIGNTPGAGSAAIVSLASQLPNTRAKLAAVRNGTGNLKLLCIGDSTTNGTGDTTAATIPQNNAWPARLVSMLNSRGIVNAANGIGVPPAHSGGTNDTRWTLGNWVNGAGAQGFGSVANWQATNPASPIVFAWNQTGSVDTFDVWFLGGPGAGTITCTATGGTPVVVNTGALSLGYYKLTCIAAAAATSNTVSITCTGGCTFAAVDPYLSTGGTLRVGNVGMGASNTDNWCYTGGAAGSNGIDMQKAYGADLTVIMLGINDNTGLVPVSRFLTNIATLTAAAQLTGDVIIGSVVPTNPATFPATTTWESQAMPLLKSQAAQANVPYVDIYNRFGSWTQANALGMMFDALHPNNLGYFDMADAVTTLLASL